MTLKHMTLDPRPSRKKPTGGLGGRSRPVGLGFGIPPAARVRIRPHYPELPVRGQEGIWVGLGIWSWVREIFPGFWRLQQGDLDFQHF